MQESLDYLPVEDLLPQLTPEEVERFVALGRRGKELLRAGEPDKAERAFREQILVFRLNYEPFVSLALLEAGRGRDDAAIDYLHDAVVRGFFDLRDLVQSEAWTGIGRPTRFLKLVDALPVLIEREQRWPEWRRTFVPPQSVEPVVARHRSMTERVDAMAPALGRRLTRLWHQQLDALASSALFDYVQKYPDAPDVEEAATRLMTLLVGGPLQRWSRLPAEPSRRLIAAAETILERFPESDARATALVALAVGKNAVRDEKNSLRPDAARTIRASLTEVVSSDADTPLLPTAVVGLLRTCSETGDARAASELYADFLSRHASDDALLDRVRGDLGTLALEIGGLPDFHATTLEGKMADRELLAGRVAVVDFWATWCGPCVEEFPSLRRIDEKYGDDVVVLGVNLNGSDELPPRDLREWIAGRELHWDQIHDGLSWDSELVRQFGVKEIPFNVVVGPDGRVLAVNRHGKRLEKTVRGAMRTAQAR